MPEGVDPVSEVELSIVVPCLNEAEMIGVCIEKAEKPLRELGVAGEIVVADNGSLDGSREIAEKLGARAALESGAGIERDVSPPVVDELAHRRLRRMAPWAATAVAAAAAVFLWLRPPGGQTPGNAPVAENAPAEPEFESVHKYDQHDRLNRDGKCQPARQAAHRDVEQERRKHKPRENPVPNRALALDGRQIVPEYGLGLRLHIHVLAASQLGQLPQQRFVGYQIPVFG